MKNIITLVVAAVTVVTIVACTSQPQGSEKSEEGFIVIKRTDLDKLNLKGKVKEWIETVETTSIYGGTDYTEFNENGYISKIDHVSNGMKNVRRENEKREYDENNNLTKVEKFVGDRGVYRYDSSGNLIQHNDKTYRYERTGGYTCDVYVGDVCSANIEYDKYKNKVKETKWSASGAFISLKKHEYKYDRQGNIILKKEYQMQTKPDKPDVLERESRYTYNKNNRVLTEDVDRYRDFGHRSKDDKYIATGMEKLSIQYIYNEQGDMIEKNESMLFYNDVTGYGKWEHDDNPYMNYKEKTKYHYSDYDKQGNWNTRIVSKSSGGKPTRTVRTFLYYTNDNP